MPFLFDLRVAVRRLLARRGSSAIAILTLSIGIGAVSTMYVLFSAATIELPPVPAADRVGRITIEDVARREIRIPPAPDEWRAWLQSPPRGVALALVESREVTVDSGVHEANAQIVSASFFDVAGVRPQLGRPFVANEEHVVIISSRAWELLPSDRRRLGTTLLIDGQPHSVVGVMPAGFWIQARDVDVWLPRTAEDHPQAPTVLARLDGPSASQAGAALTSAVQRLRGTSHRARVMLYSADAGSRQRTIMLMIVGPALLVLLAVSANISALLLGWVYARRRELAVRAALGAGRSRLVLEAFCDAVVIATLGGIAAVAGACWSIRALGAAFESVSPGYAALIPSFGAVVPIAAGSALVGVLAVGYAPALFAARIRIVPALAGTGPSPFRAGSYGMADLLLVLQIAIASALVLWTAVFTTVFKTVLAVQPHVPISRIWAVSISGRDRPMLSAQDTARLLQQAATAAGVETAALVEDVPGRHTWIAKSGAASETTCTASVERIRGAYFATHRFPARGAFPNDGEAVLNDAASRRCGAPATIRDVTARTPERRVVGSVSDGVLAVEAMRGSPTVYEPLIAPEGRDLAVFVLMRATGSSTVGRLRDGLAASFPRLAVKEPTLLANDISRQSSAAALVTTLLAVLAGLALVFGIVGVHAAITQALTARTREIGIRIALGASPRSIIATTIGHHAAPAAVGIALGAGISIVGLALLSTDDASLVRELAMSAATSLRWWAILIVVLLVATLLSALAPVVRALRVNPAEVLRAD